jgi:hypothetical protein
MTVKGRTIKSMRSQESVPYMLRVLKEDWIGSDRTLLQNVPTVCLVRNYRVVWARCKELLGRGGAHAAVGVGAGRGGSSAWV